MGPSSPSDDTNDVVESLQTLSGTQPKQEDVEMKERENSPSKKSVTFRDSLTHLTKNTPQLISPKPLPAPDM